MIDQKVIFLWIPKCAGVSIRNELQTHYGSYFEAYNNQWDNLVFDPQITCTTFYHSHITALVQTNFIPIEWAVGAFKFAFVRNPWDRLVSLYFWLKLRQYKWLPGCFEEFVQVVANGNYSHPGVKNLEGYVQANQMVEWLRPNGVWLPNFIGRFETIQADWLKLCTILRINYQPLPNNNASKHTPYQEYYTVSTRDLVARKFADDISCFNYTFD